jgi:hypothetical protein
MLLYFIAELPTLMFKQNTTENITSDNHWRLEKESRICLPCQKASTQEHTEQQSMCTALSSIGKLNPETNSVCCISQRVLSVTLL